jgi:hypothetical protein
MARKQLHLVIHHLDRATSLGEAKVAFTSNADGVFLISHNGADHALIGLAKEIKNAYPKKLVGINLLQSTALDALRLAAEHGIDMVWADDPGVRSDQVTSEAIEIGHWLVDHGGSVLFFGSVAFKYQPNDPNPAKAALSAAKLGMIPTTSGQATGQAPDVDKVRAMREALGPNYSLGIASGITPDNVSEYTPYATHFLVATGVSKDQHHFDQAKVDQLATEVLL